MSDVIAWGIYDTKDNCWLGDDDDNGPKLFRSTDVVNGKVLGDDAETLARVAGQINDVRQGWGPGRSRARVFTEAKLHLKDELPHRMSAKEALKRIERGAVI